MLISSMICLSFFWMLVPSSFRSVALIVPPISAPVHVSLPFASTLNLSLMESPLVPKYMLALPPNSLAVR